MIAILRNRKTGLYYSSCNRWVPDPCLALDFEEIENPGLLAFEQGGAELEVVIRCEDPSYELALPIRLEWHGGLATRLVA
jgi:hypothetical protein